MNSSVCHHLDSRARRLLRALVEQYIADGQPVGSRTLAKHSGLDISPATIRNVMADLEEIGLLAAPHTSAGRIPTAQGYRVFVDSLLEVRPLNESEVAQLRRDLPANTSTQELLSGTSSLLSEITHFVGVVTVPQREEFPLRHIDFVAAGEKRVLVVLIFSDAQVQNRVIETTRTYSSTELEQTANYLNHHYSGLRLQEIREKLLREMRETSVAVNKLMSAALDVARGAFAPDPSADMMVTGQTNLMGGGSGLSDMDRLRELFEAFQRKRDILQLLENCASAEGVRLFIGEESGFTALGECSLVTATYGMKGRVLGVLGVIGPTRMAYERVIPVVQTTAKLLSNVLNQTH